MNLTPTQLIALYITAIGPNGSPNGNVYAHMMAQGVNLDVHNVMLGYLKKANCMTESNFFLTLTPKGLDIYAKLKEAILTA